MSFKIKIFLFSIIYSLASANALAQSDYSLKGYVKTLGSAQKFTGSDWLYEGIIHNRLDFSYYYGTNFTFNASVRNRFFSSDNAVLNPNYGLQMAQDNGYMNLNHLYFQNNSLLAISQIDRINFDFFIGDFQITLGRQRINWGQTFVWNPNDVFNQYSFFDFDYEERPGSDAIRLQYYLSEDSKLELSTSINSKDELTSMMLYRFNTKGFDLQFIGGLFQESDIVLGTGFSGTLLSGGFSGELTYYQSIIDSLNSKSVVIASLHYDYTFENTLALQFELLYNGFADSKTTFSADMYSTNLSPKMIFPGEFAVFSSIAYSFTPLLSANFSSMYSPNSNFVYLGPSLSYSLSDNLQISMIGQYFNMEIPLLSSNIEGVYIFSRLKYSL